MLPVTESHRPCSWQPCDLHCASALLCPDPFHRVIADVNRQLVGDFADSGQFVTLFYLTVDPTRQVLEWVRAGHEPAIFYDPAANAFLELAGSGMALGVDKHCQYEKIE